LVSSNILSKNNQILLLFRQEMYNSF